MAISLTSPKEFRLERYPKTKDSSLRAWNAADELVIEHLQQHLHQKPNKTVIINDQFGALALSLQDFSPILWTDSFLSQRAYQENFSNNQLDCQRLSLIETQFNKDAESNFGSLKTGEYIDLLVIRIPKHNSLLEFQLQQLRPYLKDTSVIVGAGMTKDIHKSNLNIFESRLGPTKTSLAKKKARLIFSQLKQTPQPINAVSQYHLDQYQLTLYGYAGVFSREKLDIGTQVLLPLLPDLQAGQQVVDLGCGNGVIAAVMAKQSPNAKFFLTDESKLAIESAKLTFSRNQLSNAEFLQTDCLQGLSNNTYDYVICNPPFHQQNVQTLSIAAKMFRQASQKLNRQGRLIVVANRHLKYRSMLNRYFTKVAPISADKKFTVWLAEFPK